MVFQSGIRQNTLLCVLREEAKAEAAARFSLFSRTAANKQAAAINLHQAEGEDAELQEFRAVGPTRQTWHTELATPARSHFPPVPVKLTGCSQPARLATGRLERQRDRNIFT